MMMTFQGYIESAVLATFVFQISQNKIEGPSFSSHFTLFTVDHPSFLLIFYVFSSNNRIVSRLIIAQFQISQHVRHSESPIRYEIATNIYIESNILPSSSQACFLLFPFFSRRQRKKVPDPIHPRSRLL